MPDTYNLYDLQHINYIHHEKDKNNIGKKPIDSPERQKKTLKAWA